MKTIVTPTSLWFHGSIKDFRLFLTEMRSQDMRILDYLRQNLQ